MSKIALKLHKRSVTELIALANNICTKMAAAAATFSSPVIPIAQVTTAIDNLVDAVASATDKGRTAVQLRNTAAKVLKELLKQQAAYVESIAAGDGDIIMVLAGMDLKRVGPRMYENVYPPQNLVISYTKNSAELKLKWSTVSNAKNYSVQVSTTPLSDDSWKEIRSCTKANCILSGLERGASLWFRVNAKAAAGVSTFSEPVMKIVP
jgi:hypothetical protein